VAEVPGGPVFVVGPMGSGTTLMRLALDSHDNLALAPETGLARLLLAHEHVPFWKFGAEWYGRLGLTRDDLDAQLRAFYGGIYGAFAARHGAVRWGDKTPFHTWHMHRLARVFPDAVFVGTVRHPGAVAASLHDRFGFTWAAGVRHWVRSTTEMVWRGSRLGDRFLLCRYEDVVTDPEPVLRELFDWLGEPWLPQVLAFHEVHQARGTAVEVEGRTRSDEPLDPARIARWTDSADGRLSRLLRRDTAVLAGMLGYDLDEPVPCRPLSGTLTRRTADGILLAETMCRTRGIDWSNRPRPTLENRPMRAKDLKLLREKAAKGAGPAAGIATRFRSAPPWARRLACRLPAPARRRGRELLRAVRHR
jgi:hypothetical protein